MSTPGFPAGTLDSVGTPIWISALAEEQPHHTVHVVRGLEPTEALELLGAKPRLFQRCMIPRDRPETWRSAPAEDTFTMLAGRIGDWTFVYDAEGATSFDADSSPTTVPAKKLSADGRVAATSTVTFTMKTDLGYAVDGEVVVHVINGGLPYVETELPAELQAAIDAAGTFEPSYEDQADTSVYLRVLAALADLRCTTDDLRHISLVATPFG
ncbi:hypothetical protein GCM10027176_09800 [Actinoallomurus bryophytorum]|uniref:Uncharacterized protein n=1 Tax=Actinoallomurus bryophytorum TaxID=1490222 RepID=A0A543BZJ6_9ACTN|nr:hypothetical protein [Actinoallomurus bryophytorum]TQL90254.1 hypothetical protein FB559_7550 [Actinoallomurus bryophytorum]